MKNKNDIYLINIDNTQDIIGIKLNDGFDILEIHNPRILFKNNFGVAIRKLPYHNGNDVVIKNYNYAYKIEDDSLINFYRGKIEHDDK